MKREPSKQVRCAIYTRKSSEENLEGGFNSLDSQREYCEAFIKSQAGLGWIGLPDRYDDAGYSVARDPRLIAETVRQAGREAQELVRGLEDERAALRSRTRDADAKARLVELDREIETLRCTCVEEKDVTAAFARFDELWATLATHEQCQIVRMLVKRVEWDGRAKRIRIVFHPTGLRGLIEQSKSATQEAAA